MEKNQNNDKRNQDTTGNESTKKTSQDFNKKETNPNNPIANKEKQTAIEEKSKPALKTAAQPQKEIPGKAPIDKTDSKKKMI